MWHIVAYNPEALPEDRVWTVSRNPKEEGWETDCGYDGYGLTRADAFELANAANCLGILTTNLLARLLDAEKSGGKT